MSSLDKKVDKYDKNFLGTTISPVKEVAL